MDLTKPFGGVEPPADLDRLGSALAGLDEGLTAVRGTAVSDDGYVEATVGAGGRLEDLVIDPRVFRTPDTETLAASILQACSAAATAADEEAEQVMRRLLPHSAGGVPVMPEFG